LLGQSCFQRSPGTSRQCLPLRPHCAIFQSCAPGKEAIPLDTPAPSAYLQSLCNGDHEASIEATEYASDHLLESIAGPPEYPGLCHPIPVSNFRLPSKCKMGNRVCLRQEPLQAVV